MNKSLFNEYWFNPQLALLRSIEAYLINQFLTPSKKAVYIDIGCGSGRFAMALKNRFNEGMDISFERVASAEQKHVYDRCWQGSILNLGDLYPGKYDVVLANSVMEHLSDTSTAVESIWKALKPRGVFLITVPLADSQNYAQLKYMTDTFHNAFIETLNGFYDHKQLLNADQWLSMLTDAGFAISQKRFYLNPKTKKLLDAFNPFNTHVNSSLSFANMQHRGASVELLADLWLELFAPYFENEISVLGKEGDGVNLFAMCTKQ